MKKKRHWMPVYLLTITTVLLLAIWCSRTVTVISENLSIERKNCIIIDPGHGGEDGGAISCTGLPESSYNLEIALRLNELFHLLGYETKMVRTSDISIYTRGETLAQKKASDLKERVKITEETENPLLLSIHQNFYQDKRYSGAQVFYPSTTGSEQLAKQLQSVFQNISNSQNRRQAKKCTGIYLMEHIQCPGVLIECGFLSNAEEEAKLRNADYQKKLCCIITATVDSFLSNT